MTGRWTLAFFALAICGGVALGNIFDGVAAWYDWAMFAVWAAAEAGFFALLGAGAVLRRRGR